MDIYLINNSTGKIWSNVLLKSYVDNEKNSAMYASQLIRVSAAADKYSVADYVLYDSTIIQLFRNVLRFHPSFSPLKYLADNIRCFVINDQPVLFFWRL